MPVPHVDEPLHAVAEDAIVRVEGQAGIALDMTPEAALESMEHLQEAALQAIGQRKLQEWQIGKPPR